MNYETALNLEKPEGTPKRGSFWWLMKQRIKGQTARPKTKGDANLGVPHIVALAHYRNGFGVKRICDAMGIGRHKVGPLLQVLAQACQIDGDARRIRSPWKHRARELDADNTLWARHDQWWIRAYSPKPLSQMERYYADHEHSRQAAAAYALRRYHSLKHTPTFVLKRAARNCLKRITRKVAWRKASATRTQQYLGCTYEEARLHLEAQFRDGMTWANHGTHWEIDHIKPLAAFDLMDDTQRRAAMHFSNLQPLTKRENRMKSDRWAA